MRVQVNSVKQTSKLQCYPSCIYVLIKQFCTPAPVGPDLLICSVVAPTERSLSLSQSVSALTQRATF